MGVRFLSRHISVSLPWVATGPSFISTRCSHGVCLFSLVVLVALGTREGGQDTAPAANSHADAGEGVDVLPASVLPLDPALGLALAHSGRVVFVCEFGGAVARRAKDGSAGGPMGVVSLVVLGGLVDVADSHRRPLAASRFGVVTSDAPSPMLSSASATSVYNKVRVR